MKGAEVILERRSSEAAGTGGAMVGVAVSLFNLGDTVVEALRSVAAQTHPRLELIVVDDRSEDQSLKVAADWMECNAGRFERVLLLRQDRNRGLGAARDTAFAAAESDALMVLDADNMLTPHAVARLWETMEEFSAPCVYSQLLIAGIENGIGVADIWSGDAFLKDNYIDAMALISVAAWRLVGGYYDPGGGWEDYDFWCRFVEHGLKGIYVPELLCVYHVRANSMLRSETIPERSRLVHHMLARHPWLNLEL